MIILSMKCSYEGGGADVLSTQTTSDAEGPPIHPTSKLQAVNYQLAMLSSSEVKLAVFW